jgi:hypothetical protein
MGYDSQKSIEFQEETRGRDDWIDSFSEVAAS